MIEQRGGSWIVPLMWMIAAVLSWIAAGVRYARGGDFNWPIAAAGLFWAVLALNGWNRWRASASAEASAASTPGERAARPREPD